MTKLTNAIQNIGLHDAGGTCNAISTKEAIVIRELMKQKCIDAVCNVKFMYDAANYSNMIIKAIEDIE